MSTIIPTDQRLPYLGVPSLPEDDSRDVHVRVMSNIVERTYSAVTGDWLDSLPNRFPPLPLNSSC